MAQPVFRKESLDKINSPEQLNDYIKVSSIGVWAILSAVVILLVCLGIWSIFGNLNTTVRTNGTAQNGTVLCYTDEAARIEVGQTVTFSDGSTGSVTAVAQTPVSKAEVESRCDDYTAFVLDLSEWNYPVTISAPDCADGLVSAEIVIETIHPISFIWH